ncbi:amidohydrolase family protein [soil metagenome]
MSIRICWRRLGSIEPTTPWQFTYNRERAFGLIIGDFPAVERLSIPNLRSGDGQPVDLLIEADRLASIGPAPQPGSQVNETIDGGGRLVIPALVDAHAHMDKSLLGRDWYVNETGPTLQEMVNTERRYRVEHNIDFREQTCCVGRRMIASGTTHTRSFVDIDTDIGLSAFEGLVQTREDLKDGLSIQIVAFPQSGMLIRPGTVELMDEALRNGADVVGGLDPSSMDRDPKGHLDTIFAMAERHDKDIDIHLHEPGDLGAFSIELIAERTRVLGFEGRVAISHAFSLGGVNAAYLETLIELLLANNIAIMSHGPSGGRPAPPVKRLREAGVRLCAGNDGIRDTWGPLNMPDMLLRAFLIAYRNNFRRDEDVQIALDMCTYGGANVIGLQGYGTTVGDVADLVIVDGQNPTEAMIERPARWLVLKAGQIVARDGCCLI